jgi:hypothetical protein
MVASALVGPWGLIRSVTRGSANGAFCASDSVYADVMGGISASEAILGTDPAED